MSVAPYYRQDPAYQQPTPIMGGAWPQPAPSEHVMRLAEWADEARAAHALAESLCKTEFAGAWRGNPVGGAAAILKGAEVGLTPVTALGAFDPIQGQAAPKAMTLRALVQSAGHDVWIEKSDDSICVAKGQRKGSDKVHQSKWTLDRARGLNLTGKDNWKKQPTAMLVARATAEVCRMVASDVILGIGYAAEELDDQVDSTATKPTRVRRTTVEIAPEPEPDLEPAKEIGDAPEGITDAQSKKLHTLLGKTGRSDRDAGLAFCSGVIGRPIDSTKELTKHDAMRIIDRLEADETAEPEPMFDEKPQP